jgi:hypothetical protein
MSEAAHVEMLADVRDRTVSQASAAAAEVVVGVVHGALPWSSPVDLAISQAAATAAEGAGEVALGASLVTSFAIEAA